MQIPFFTSLPTEATLAPATGGTQTDSPPQDGRATHSGTNGVDSRAAFGAVYRGFVTRDAMLALEGQPVESEAETQPVTESPSEADTSGDPDIQSAEIIPKGEADLREGDPKASNFSDSELQPRADFETAMSGDAVRARSEDHGRPGQAGGKPQAHRETVENPALQPVSTRLEQQAPLRTAGSDSQGEELDDKPSGKVAEPQAKQTAVDPKDVDMGFATANARESTQFPGLVQADRPAIGRISARAVVKETLAADRSGGRFQKPQTVATVAQDSEPRATTTVATTSVVLPHSARLEPEVSAGSPQPQTIHQDGSGKAVPLRVLSAADLAPAHTDNPSDGFRTEKAAVPMSTFDMERPSFAARSSLPSTGWQTEQSGNATSTATAVRLDLAGFEARGTAKTKIAGHLSTNKTGTDQPKVSGGMDVSVKGGIGNGPLQTIGAGQNATQVGDRPQIMAARGISGGQKPAQTTGERPNQASISYTAQPQRSDGVTGPETLGRSFSVGRESAIEAPVSRGRVAPAPDRMTGLLAAESRAQGAEHSRFVQGGATKLDQAEALPNSANFSVRDKKFRPSAGPPAQPIKVSSAPTGLIDAAVPVRTGLREAGEIPAAGPAMDPVDIRTMPRPQIQAVERTAVEAATLQARSVDASRPEILLSPSEVNMPRGEQGISPTQATVAEALPVRVDAARLPVPQMVETLARHPDRPMEIQMAPEELGRVRMALSTTETGATLVITAERPETLDLMRRHIDQLAQDFRRMGYEDIGFEFRNGGGGSETNQRGHGGNAEVEKHPGTAAETSGANPVPQQARLASTGLDLRV